MQSPQSRSRHAKSKALKPKRRAKPPKPAIRTPKPPAKSQAPKVKPSRNTTAPRPKRMPMGLTLRADDPKGMSDLQLMRFRSLVAGGVSRERAKVLAFKPPRKRSR